MAELLVMAFSTHHADPIKDRRGCAKRGDISVSKPDGWFWGSQERPPKHVVVACREIDQEDADSLAVSWDYRYDFEVIARDESVDGWRFRIYNPDDDNVHSVSPQEQQVRLHFEKHWNAVFRQMDARGGIFDWTITHGLTSRGFWDLDLEQFGITVTPVGYDQATGYHTAEVAYGSRPTVQAVERYITRAGGIVLSTVPDAVGNLTTFTIHRDFVKDKAMAWVRSQREKYKQCRYSFSDADVDAALAAGGFVTLTLAQLQNRLIDHRSP